MSFFGTADLPKFPCPLTDDCVGTFVGTAEGTVGGQQFEVWEATLRGAVLEATFEYADSQCTDGSAVGDAELDADLGHVVGFWRIGDDPNGVPVPIVGLTAQIHFDWVRSGATARLRLLTADVQLELPPGALPGGATVIQVMNDATGNATAAFAPLFDGIEDTPDCVVGTSPGIPIKADVVGGGTLVDI